MKGGDLLYLRPEHAAYYVKEGLLIEEAEPEAKAEEAAIVRDPQPPVGGTNKLQVFV